ncbi:hypothetical protein D9611_010554 [Ephemerocybe angulata]|uniref:Uncharacterized protein n=1 Tax=Ephemerocybe angulata TaxID=980116 RepID=A0A8H5BWC6_9AGAR|nr:hypothetical protein D9611_010554 [Tulosesus angulatus]
MTRRSLARGANSWPREAEATFTRRGSSASQQDRPLVGVLINEGRVDYNMPTAIFFSFDLLGSELTPWPKCDSKFKGYIRLPSEDHFQLSPPDYLLSPTSGSFFYLSCDLCCFIIKTIRHAVGRNTLRVFLLELQNASSRRIIIKSLAKAGTLARLSQCGKLYAPLESSRAGEGDSSAFHLRRGRASTVVALLSG